MPLPRPRPRPTGPAPPRAGWNLPLSMNRRCACGSLVTRNTASLQEPKAALSSTFLSGANKQLLMSSWAYVLDVITTRISALGTGQGVDTQSLQADSCMGSLSIRGCLGKKKNPALQRLLKPACPRPGDSQVQLPATPLLAGRTVSSVLSWGQLVESCPAQAALSDMRRKHRGLSRLVASWRISFFASPCYHEGQREAIQHRGVGWRTVESYRIGSEPRFCCLLAG